MKYLIAIFLVAVSFNDLDRIARVNKIKKEAKEAFNSGDYKIAAEKYTFLLDSMQVEDDNVKLNLANAYYQLRDTTNALDGYNDLTDSNNKLVKSVAHQQLGVMANRDKKIDEALDHFKDALRANPNNDDARYNYELLKKIKEEEKKKEEEQQQNKDNKDQNKDQQDKKKEDEQQSKEQKEDEQQSEEQKKDKQKEDSEQKDSKDQKSEDQKAEEEKDKDGKGEDQKKKDEQTDKEKEAKEQKESDKEEDPKDKMDPMGSSEEKVEQKISREKANMILESYRRKEKQYLQQNKRKPTKRKDKGKPDW